MSDYPECVENGSVNEVMGDTKFPECVATSHQRSPTIGGHGNESQYHQRRPTTVGTKLVKGSSTSLKESKTVEITELWGTRSSQNVSLNRTNESRIWLLENVQARPQWYPTWFLHAKLTNFLETQRLKPRGNGPTREHTPLT